MNAVQALKQPDRKTARVDDISVRIRMNAVQALKPSALAEATAEAYAVRIRMNAVQALKPQARCWSLRPVSGPVRIRMNAVQALKHSHHRLRHRRDILTRLESA